MYGGEPQINEVELVRSLMTTKANYSLSAQELSVTRGAIQQRVNASPELKRLVHDLREGKIDRAESQADAAVERGEAWAVTLTLKTLGKSRGWFEKSEVSILLDQLRIIEEKLNEQRTAIGPGSDQPLSIESGNTTTDDNDL